MVTLIPPYMGEEIKSNAEKKLYEVLTRLELKNAYVLHSLGLPKHQTKIYGEIDFVVVCDRGIACLEIKGGRVECREGIWYFTDRYGSERAKAEGPFAQVIGNMFSLREVLRQKFRGNSNKKHILMACGVVFPDIEFKSASQEIIQEIIYDKRTACITDYINRIFDYWQERQHRGPDRLTPTDIKEIVNYLRGEFTFVPTLGVRLAQVESRLIRLTAEQAQVMDALASNDHLLIEGNAGTGKTLLAVDFARKRAALGERVLFLTYNKNLAHNVSEQMEKQENLKIINIHALFGEYIHVDVAKMQENPQKYFSEILPESFYEYVSGLGEEELTALRYDVLVMDEGQDILRPLYLYSLDSLLNGGLQKGRWTVFYDEKQNIYNPEYADGMEILQSYSCTRFRLFINCRNTVQIGTYSSQVSGVQMNEYIKENGEEVQKISYVDAEDFKKHIKSVLKHLQSEGVAVNDVVFLAPKRFPKSMLADTGIKVNELGDQYDETAALPVYATIQGFKGLDAKVVILFDVDHIRPENFSKFIYIAGTRARTLLYVVASEEFWKEHN